METDPGLVTQMLEAVSAGKEGAGDELFTLVYTELRRMARSKMAAERPGHTLQPTALVHEVYLRLLRDQKPHWGNRAHFFAAAAEAMRRILIERARSRGRLKRGGEVRHVQLETADGYLDPDSENLLALDQALTGLEARDAQMARVVKLRYFAGLTVEETAQALQVSPRTINRQWSAARAWLHRELASRNC